MLPCGRKVTFRQGLGFLHLTEILQSKVSIVSCFWLDRPRELRDSSLVPRDRFHKGHSPYPYEVGFVHEIDQSMTQHR